MRAFLLRCKDTTSGGYKMHVGGETDTRGCYTALAVSHLLGLLDEELTAGVADFVTRCQTHEGGIGGEPGAEAHGGYTFCGLAAAMLCGPGGADRLDLPELLHWWGLYKLNQVYR
jgi:protein farnesyltransferase subunit beta